MELKRKFKWLWIVLAGSVLVVSLTGLTFSQLSSLNGEEPVKVELVRKVPANAPTLEELHPGELSQRELAVRNTGKAACYLRVKLCIPQAEGKAVFETGFFSSGAFRKTGDGVGESDEYWACEGEYICYKNRKTGDLLLPGKETPLLYDAVRLSPEARPELLPADMRGGLYASVQAVPAGTAVEEDDLWSRQAS